MNDKSQKWHAFKAKFIVHGLVMWQKETESGHKIDNNKTPV